MVTHDATTDEAAQALAALALACAPPEHGRQA